MTHNMEEATTLPTRDFERMPTATCYAENHIDQPRKPQSEEARSTPSAPFNLQTLSLAEWRNRYPTQSNEIIYNMPCSSGLRASTVGHGEGCCDNFLKCLSLVPVPTLLSWILLLVGIGGLTGGLLFATWKTQDLLEDDSLLWMMEYTVIGVSSGMFLVGCLILIASHLSSEPTSRRVFNSFTKNKCAQGMNIFALVVCYFLAISWILATVLLAVPLVFIIHMLIVDPDSLDLGTYGFKGGVKTGAYLDAFKTDCKDLLVCWGIAFCSSFVIVNSLICFIICVTANITHLRDNRFCTLNAYGSEEVRNSKPSVVDTNM